MSRQKHSTMTISDENNNLEQSALQSVVWCRKNYLKKNRQITCTAILLYLHRFRCVSKWTEQLQKCSKRVRNCSINRSEVFYSFVFIWMVKHLVQSWYQHVILSKPPFHVFPCGPVHFIYRALPKQTLKFVFQRTCTVDVNSLLFE